MFSYGSSLMVNDSSQNTGCRPGILAANDLYRYIIWPCC